MNNDKYVAFIDILGFREKVKMEKQEYMVTYIKDFSNIAYSAWVQNDLQNNNRIKGHLISDSIIISSIDKSKDSLQKILDYLILIFKKSFSKKILLRAALTKGQFNDADAISLSNLSKGLIVGEAYIRAYTLESQIKGSLIILDNKTKKDIDEWQIINDKYKIRKSNIKDADDKDTWLLSWADLKYLKSNTHIEQFIEMGNKAGWLSHYYETLYMFLSNEKPVEQQKIFTEIFMKLDAWENKDKFIENAFKGNDIDHRFRMMFKKYIRISIDEKLERKKNELEFM